MYLRLISLFVIVFLSLGFKIPDYHKNLRTPYTLRQILGLYQQKDLLDNLRQFVAAGRPNRLVGTPSHLQAGDFLLERLKQKDNKDRTSITVEEFSIEVASTIKAYQEQLALIDSQSENYVQVKRFSDSMVSFLKTLEQKRGRNIIWEKKGTTHPDELIVLGAHYDTMALNQETGLIEPEFLMPGADNNGSGVAILLSMIEVLQAMDLPRTVRIVFFDYGEAGALGSKAYAQTHKAELLKKKAVVLNAFMLGHDTKRDDTTKREGNMRAYIRKENESDRTWGQKLIRLGDQVVSGVKFELIENDFSFGDSASFWGEGVPAVTFSQNWEEDFNQSRNHTSNDFVETLNFRTLEGNFRFLTGAVLSWAYQFGP